MEISNLLQQLKPQLKATGLITRIRKPLMSLDLETTGLDWDCDIVSYAFCDGRVSNAVKFSDGFRDKLQNLLDKYCVIFHNSSFDLRVLKNNGFCIPSPGDYQDTMLLAYCINPCTSLKLKDLIEGKLDMGSYYDWRKTKASPELLKYNEQDARITFELFEILRSQTLPCIWEYYSLIELPYSAIIREMNDTGFYIDTVKLNDEVIPKIDRQISSIIEEIKTIVPSKIPQRNATKKYVKPRKDPNSENLLFAREIYDESLKKNFFYYRKIEEFNPNSAWHKEYCLRLTGWNPEKKTDFETGKEKNTSVSLSVLKSINNPLAKLLCQYSKLKKLKSGFFEPWLKTLSSNTSGSTHNRLRTNFNQCFTRTGRLSSSKPLNLQNVPARGEIGKTLRSLFIPPPGYDLIIGDDSAIELRIMAEYFAKIAGDFSWIDIFKTDADLHTYNAKLLGFEEIFAASLNLNISDPIVQKAARDAAKTAAYGAAYGAGALKLGDGDKEKGKQIYDAILQKMPSLNLCKLLAQATVIHNKGTIWDLFGHLGYYDLSSIVFQKDAEKPKRQLFNFMIQSSSASRIKSRVLLAKPFLEKHRALIASCTHDEYMIYCPCDRAPQELAEKLTAVFSAPDSLSYCPVVFEFKVCKNWSDK